jgi:putative cardiolipin synthase
MMKIVSAVTYMIARRSSILSLLLLAVLLGGCASVDFDYPKQESTAILDTNDTRLGQRISPLLPQHPGESGFYLLSDGIEALAARILLAERAERTLDAQYYLITNDDIGFIFIGSLLETADRGVRVRLLLDDIQTKGYDAGMAALDSHPNLEVRIFNPFGVRGIRAGNITDFGRVNRRMHNKSMTADNQITIIGGRNIAAEYFSYRDDVNFGDVDVLAIGPAVQDVSSMFDTYWNSRYAAPIPAFAKMPDDPAAELVKLRERIKQASEEASKTPYAEAFDDTLDEYVSKTEEHLDWAPYRIVYDSPDKADKKKAADAASIVTPLKETVELATRELTIVSPYFVPLKTGIAYLSELQASGVQINVITNSLAANNHGIVHAGYAPSRKPLLKAGIKIYEMRADAAVLGVDRGGSGAALATLHTKAFLVDREHFFLGSFNWDPRSVKINTELGVIIESPEMGARIGHAIDLSLDNKTYEVVLDEKGHTRWIDRSGEEEVWLDHEPQTSWWRRFSVGFMRILPGKSQL